MANNNHGLGRGLASLIPPKRKNIIQPIGSEDIINDAKTAADVREDNGTETIVTEPKPGQKESKEGLVKSSPPAVTDEFLEVPIEKIATNPQQPRHDFIESELRALADSIQEHGILQPLIVTKIAPEQFELIAGERRLKAAKLAGLQMVPVIVREEAGEREKLELALVENIQRHNLNVIEEARAFKKLTEEYDLTQEEMSARVGKSRSAVANKVRLLHLPVEIQRSLIEGKISEGHARSILAIENPEQQRALFELIIKDNLTVRQVEDKVREITVSTHQRRVGGRPRVSEFKEKEDLLGSNLGTKVTIKKSGGGGKIIIEFYSPEELESLCAKIG